MKNLISLSFIIIDFVGMNRKINFGSSHHLCHMKQNSKDFSQFNFFSNMLKGCIEKAFQR